MPRPLLSRAITVAARRAAAPGDLRFTERQLYYETCRVLRPRPAPLRRVPYSPPPPVRLPHFTEALHALDLPGLLPAAEPAPTTGAPAREPDLYDYGVPRLLICQNREIAGMLLANHVHLEAACPILAAPDDLPLDPRLTGALARAGAATVHVLHDASPTGITLPAKVRDSLGPVPGVRVVSLGLVPRHAQTLHLVSGRRPGRVPPIGPLPHGLKAAEVDWLASGRFAEVAAVPPARLVRAVLRLTRAPRPARASAWSELRDLRTAGFMTWPDA
ncbi:hypothetical protein [Streptomyces acidiscabies]|uniref:Uncharacterized protein n=1 Tax=Streptomyces acidiscabies TaxID=42234 RepID=A0AAP6BJH5_9ACTN|nr:hypothetical protein [Streptomyces acidiscabies]MBP5942374.1 hypothetical protein [Streptomyces sp. LBUM 1476]MBZ3913948.1 hypothetical protein [Streptomyces acidiscabies]MDX2965893.1 hypothetical protein [Streptomyces acidiscabies]MDX3025279.1 hypothetical protein [Streptomyces acidiscabies]MDX3795728.1 hypothetical protein [Streptomyces acidiscabies]